MAEEEELIWNLERASSSPHPRSLQRLTDNNLIGTLFCNLLEDAMRLHLQPRLDMSEDPMELYEHLFPFIP